MEDCKAEISMECEFPQKLTLARRELVKGQNFSLHYDYGDYWMFTIHVLKIEEELRKKPPALFKAVGSVEHYPDWDEWDDEEDEDE